MSRLRMDDGLGCWLGVIALISLLVFVLLPIMGHLAWNVVLVRWGGLDVNPFGYWQCCLVGLLMSRPCSPSSSRRGVQS